MHGSLFVPSYNYIIKKFHVWPLFSYPTLLLDNDGLSLRNPSNEKPYRRSFIGIISTKLSVVPAVLSCGIISTKPGRPSVF